MNESAMLRVAAIIGLSAVIAFLSVQHLWPVAWDFIANMNSRSPWLAAALIIVGTWVVYARAIRPMTRLRRAHQLMSSNRD